MNATSVVSVLLADGWHRIVPGSFTVGPLDFGSGTGFRFEEADAGSPYQPTVLAGPLDSIIAVRGIGAPDRPQAVPNSHRSGQSVRLRAHAIR